MDQTVARIAEQLGFQAARIWPQVVMVTWVTSLFWAIVDPIVVTAAVVGIVLMVKRTLAEVRDQQLAYQAAKANAAGSGYVSSFDYDSIGWLMACSIICLLLAFAGMLALTSFPDQLAGAIYPEATTVLRIAKGLK